MATMSNRQPAETDRDREADALVARLRALASREAAFGPTYQPLYHAALPWYEQWGQHTSQPVDSWMVAPKEYAGELADALEHGRNYIAGNAGASFPLVYEQVAPDGGIRRINYRLSLPAGFGEAGRKFPLIIDLHGSGWVGHRISYSRGGTVGGRAFWVTPISESRPWDLDFLNGYLDDLLRMLPIDPDRVYVQGHSLGAMATWDWAMNHPERFAAISPRAGNGASFRASRLKNVPAWVIHGSADDVVLPAYSDQMVTALQAAGGTVKYSLLKGAPHNMPADFDQEPVTDWYLQQSRSAQPVPPDPVDALGVGASGFSDWTIVDLPEGPFWKSVAVPMASQPALNGTMRTAEQTLYQKVQDAGALVDSAIRQELDPQTRMATLYLAVPKDMQARTPADGSVVSLARRQGARFYGRGDVGAGIEHARQIVAKLRESGRRVSDKVWVTSLTPWRPPAYSITEYWLAFEQ